MYATVKCTHIRRIFKTDLLENEVSNEKILLFIFYLFFHVESPPLRLYCRHRNILYGYTYSIIYYLIICLKFHTLLSINVIYVHSSSNQYPELAAISKKLNRIFLLLNNNKQQILLIMYV